MTGRGPITLTRIRVLEKTKRGEQVRGHEWESRRKCATLGLVERIKHDGDEAAPYRWSLTLAGELALAAFECGRSAGYYARIREEHQQRAAKLRGESKR